MSDLFPYDKSPIPTVPDLSDQIECTTELISRGGYGTVYKGRWLGAATNTTPATIAIKIIDLVPLRDDAKRKRRFKQITRELSLWCSIQHENILPLLGIACINGDTNVPAFVCPWMENGNAKEFCSRNPRFPPILILYDIINGLHYLHTFKPEIVHGDIKAVNVLINNRCEACLCDFGLSRFITDNTLWKTTATAAGGTARWMAPELMNGDVSTPTKESDIYAYAMSCYEILSGDVPFQSVSNDIAILFKVTKGQRPNRIECFHSDFMWDIITQCWEQEPNDHLATGKVLGLLRSKVEWKGVEEEQAKIGEKDVALAKVEKEMAVLKEQMAEALAKAEEDMKTLKEQMAKALAKAEQDMKALKEEKAEALKALAKAEEDLKEKDMAWANEMTVMREQMAEAQEDTEEEEEDTEEEEGLEKTEEDLKALREDQEEALARAKAEEEMTSVRKDDRPLNMKVLGKGIPLHSVPSSCLLYIVEFKAGRTDLYYHSDQKMDVRVGDWVIVEADRGKDLGKVVNEGITVRDVETWQMQQATKTQVQVKAMGMEVRPNGQPTSSIGPNLPENGKQEINPKMLYAKAGSQDLQLLAAKTEDEMKALQLCQTKARAKRLPLEVVDAEYQWDRCKLTFYFVGEKGIDFRELVRELFRLYKT